MKEEVNVLRILKETKIAFKNNDSYKLKQLSNQTTNTSSLTQDLDNISVAVIVYSLSKIVERENYKELPGWKNFYSKINLYLDKSIQDIEKKDYDNFKKDFKKIRGSIENLSGKLKKYIKELFRNAEINKASRLHEHGISMEQTAQILGITLYELADYVGKTGIADVPESKTMNIKTRIKLAERFFK
jgi:uncharacterized protein YihD (DUF1040 family)